MPISLCPFRLDAGVLLRIFPALARFPSRSPPHAIGPGPHRLSISSSPSSPPQRHHNPAPHRRALPLPASPAPTSSSCPDLELVLNLGKNCAGPLTSFVLESLGRTTGSSHSKHTKPHAQAPRHSLHTHPRVQRTAPFNLPRIANIFRRYRISESTPTTFAHLSRTCLRQTAPWSSATPLTGAVVLQSSSPRSRSIVRAIAFCLRELLEDILTGCEVI